MNGETVLMPWRKCLVRINNNQPYESVHDELLKLEKLSNILKKKSHLKIIGYSRFLQCTRILALILYFERSGTFYCGKANDIALYRFKNFFE